MASVDEILAGKYPAKEHARRVGAYIRGHGYTGNGIIYLEAQKTRLIEDNDEPVPFRYINSLSLSFLFSCELCFYELTTVVM